MVQKISGWKGLLSFKLWNRWKIRTVFGVWTEKTEQFCLWSSSAPQLNYIFLLFIITSLFRLIMIPRQDGFYDAADGCHPCNCDMGHASSNTCDKSTGQCDCPAGVPFVNTRRSVSPHELQCVTSQIVFFHLTNFNVSPQKLHSFYIESFGFAVRIASLWNLRWF